MLAFGDGPSPLEVGLGLDLSLSVVLAEHFLARAGLGFVPAVDRHNLALHARPRLEIGARFKTAKWSQVRVLLSELGNAARRL